MGLEGDESNWTHLSPRIRADPPRGWTRCYGSEAKSGDLLPNVDPTDTATWACLLHDLATAAQIPLEPYSTVCWEPGENGVWVLYSFACGPTDSRHFNVDTDDPAVALVLARIQLR